jgi:ABC-type Mn2+/Zn2+ transport system ATPase subunit
MGAPKLQVIERNKAKQKKAIFNLMELMDLADFREDSLSNLSYTIPLLGGLGLL